MGLLRVVVSNSTYIHTTARALVATARQRSRGRRHTTRRARGLAPARLSNMKGACNTYALPSVDGDFAYEFPTFPRCIEERCAKSRAAHETLLKTVTAGWSATAAKIVADWRADPDSKDDGFDAFETAYSDDGVWRRGRCLSVFVYRPRTPYGCSGSRCTHKECTPMRRTNVCWLSPTKDTHLAHLGTGAEAAEAAVVGPTQGRLVVPGQTDKNDVIG